MREVIEAFIVGGTGKGALGKRGGLGGKARVLVMREAETRVIASDANMVSGRRSSLQTALGSYGGRRKQRINDTGKEHTKAKK